MRKVIARRLIRVFLGILIAVVLVLIVWSVIAGPVTVYRVVSRGDTTIYDYDGFPDGV